MKFSPGKWTEKKRSNDAPASYRGSSDAREVKKIHQTHPRNASPNENWQEKPKSEVVRALKANNLGNNQPRVPYHRTIEHDCDDPEEEEKRKIPQNSKTKKVPQKFENPNSQILVPNSQIPN